MEKRKTYEAGTDKTFSLDTLPQEYTAYGNGDYRINGLETEQADGSDTANLKYEFYEISKGKYSLKGLPEMFAKEDGEGRNTRNCSERPCQRITCSSSLWCISTA